MNIKSLKLALSLIVTLTLGLAAGMTGVQAAGDAKQPAAIDWSFAGLFGTYDRDALRRGYQVYTEVCAACHGMDYVAFRNLAQPGGPEFSEAEVKALAAAYMVEDGPDDYGDMFERPALPKDKFVAPYPNDNAARAAEWWRLSARFVTHHQSAFRRAGLYSRSADRLSRPAGRRRIAPRPVLQPLYGRRQSCHARAFDG